MTPEKRWPPEALEVVGDVVTAILFEDERKAIDSLKLLNLDQLQELKRHGHELHGLCHTVWRSIVRNPRNRAVVG